MRLRLLGSGCVGCFHVGGVLGCGKDGTLNVVVVFGCGKETFFHCATLGKGRHGAVGNAWVHYAIAALYGAVLVGHTIVSGGQRLGLGIGQYGVQTIGKVVVGNL